MSPSLHETRATPRKRPKQARSVETVKVLIEAAARILEENGHGGYSSNAVAERAGVSIGSFYQYFPNKNALIGALVLRETALLLEEAEAAAKQPDGEAALCAFIRACVGHQFRRPSLARLLDLEEARLPFDPDTQRVGERIQQLVVTMLRKPGLQPQQNINVASRDVIAIIKGMIDAAGQHGETDEDVTAARVRRATFGYLGACRS